MGFWGEIYGVLEKMKSWLRVCRLTQFFKNRQILDANLPNLFFGWQSREILRLFLIWKNRQKSVPKECYK